MARFVSLQAYASAVFAKRNPNLQTPVRIGFAWAPKNTDNLPKARFGAGSKQVLSRLSTALSAAFTPEGSSPPEPVDAAAAIVCAGFRVPS
jgi:hypothetical protein